MADDPLTRPPFAPRGTPKERTSLYLPQGWLKVLKLHAVTHDITVTDIIQEALAAYAAANDVALPNAEPTPGQTDPTDPFTADDPDAQGVSAA